MIRTAFEDCKNVTSKRVGGPSPITVYHPPSHEAGCAWGRSIPLRKWYSWDGARAGPGAGVSFEQVAQTPPPPVTCHSWPLRPCGGCDRTCSRRRKLYRPSLESGGQLGTLARLDFNRHGFAANPCHSLLTRLFMSALQMIQLTQ